MRTIIKHLPNKRGTPLRGGFSYLELQVAFVLFALAIGGLGPLVVMQSRQLRQLENRFADDTDYYVVPSRNAWARKLGAIANVRTTAPEPAPAEPVFLIDNGDPNFELINRGTDDWVEMADRDARNRTQQRNNGGSGRGDRDRGGGGSGSGDAAAWNFVGLQPGSYKVYVTYAARDNQARNSPFSVFDDNRLLGTVRIDQRVAPSGPFLNGSRWEYLGMFVINSDVLRVVLSDSARGYIAADAVHIVPHRNTLRVVSLTKSMGSETVTANVSVREPRP
jgi:hypothetical protein